MRRASAHPAGRVASEIVSAGARDGSTDGLPHGGIHVRFKVLGPVAAETDNGPVGITRPRQWAILGFLLLNRNALVSTDRIVTAIWDDEGPATARNQVQTDVSAIRRAIVATGATDPVSTRPAGYRLDVAAGELDLDDFAARTAAARAAADPATAIASWRSALNVWSGEALTGISAAYAGSHRLHLEEQRLFGYEQLFELELNRAQGAGIVAELVSLVEQNPVRERLVMQLMTALYQAGRQAEALAQARRFRQVLAVQHGLDPGPALADLEHRMLRGGLIPGDVGPAPAPIVHSGLSGPRQLPRHVYGIAGRGGLLAELDDVLADGRRRPGFAVVVLTGSAGVGKTTLAVHWAHRVAEEFPDGQLYVNLRGFDPASVSLRPADVLRGWLISLGEPANALPQDADGLAVLFRSRLAGRRMLLLVDNARDAAQVRLLLPGDPQCLVVITSRSSLSGLVTTEGARVVPVDVFRLAEAVELLELRLGAARVSAEPMAVADIVARCARLPLAVALIAAKAVAKPGVALKTIAAELRQAHSSLDAFAVDDGEEVDIRTVFASSYATLTRPAATLFRMLGIAWVDQLTPAVAASLTATSMVEARAHLDELARAQLMVETAPERYRAHDLLRSYAGELARGTDSDPQIHAARHRLLDHYLMSAWRAATLFTPTRRAYFPFVEPDPGTTIAPLPERDAAVVWLDTERVAIDAVTAEAGASGYDEHVWQLVWCVHEYLNRQGHWSQWARFAQAAVTAAERTGDLIARAFSRRGLGRALMLLGRDEQASAELMIALELTAQLPDNQADAAVTLQILAELDERRGHYREAITWLDRALTLNEVYGRQVTIAATLNNLGWQHAQLGEWDKTLAYCERALVGFSSENEKDGEAAVHDTLGFTHRARGDHKAAIHHYGQAVELRRETGNRYAESTTLTRLGEVQLANNKPDEAVATWRLAVEILEPIDHPDLAALRERIATWS